MIEIRNLTKLYKTKRSTVKGVDDAWRFFILLPIEG